MLTAELVRARRRGKTLELLPLGAKEHAGAVELAESLLCAARGAVGRTRAELFEAFAATSASAAQRKLKDGLVKLLEDALEFEQVSAIEPAELRQELFSAAAAARRAESAFERAALIRSAASRREVDDAEIERALYSDLKSEHRVVGLAPLTVDELLERYQRQGPQAVLMRAVRVVAEVTGGSALSYRTLFAKLKFRRLLFRVEPVADGYRLTIDGPFSLFEAVTKYGLALALTLPALESAGALRLVAEVVWGPRRERLTFEYRHAAPGAAPTPPPILDEAQRLIDAFERLGGPWRAESSSLILQQPGVGVLVPDLRFVHGPSGTEVYVELVGFWSREAVFKRLDMAASGLSVPIVFAVSERLRVSEELLEDVPAASLYTYKASVSPRGLERRLDAVRRDAVKAPRPRRRR